MDNKYITEGSKVYLPVRVPGALLGLGDVHGAMGDGEITFIGLEICAEVTVKVAIEKGTAPNRPLIETPTHWITTGDHLDLGEQRGNFLILACRCLQFLCRGISR